jgi:hypothetical protein
MALKMKMESLEGLSEEIAGLYSKQDDGYVLNVEDHHEKNEQGKIPKSRLDAEIAKRKEAETELKTIAENLRHDVPENFQDLVPDLPPGKLITWIRAANIKGLFDPKSTESIDSKRPSDKKPQDFENMSPQAIMATGYNK